MNSRMPSAVLGFIRQRLTEEDSVPTKVQLVSGHVLTVNEEPEEVAVRIRGSASSAARLDRDGRAVFVPRNAVAFFEASIPQTQEDPARDDAYHRNGAPRASQEAAQPVSREVLDEGGAKVVPEDHDALVAQYAQTSLPGDGPASRISASNVAMVRA